MANKYKQDSSSNSSSKKTNNILSNYNIKARRVKVINFDGSLLGEMSTSEALVKAQDLDMDLYQLSGGDIPTCKLGDLSKFLYERRKKEKERQRQIRENSYETKQIIIHLTIDKNDLSRKLLDIQKFVELGHNVKLSLQLRGREISMKENAFKFMNDCIEKISKFVEVDTPAKLNGKFIDVIFKKIK